MKYLAHANIDEMIRSVEALDSGEADEDGAPDDATERIKEGLSFLHGCTDNGTWWHLPELSLMKMTKLRETYITWKYADLIDQHASYYFSQKRIRTKELDWLYADLLIAYTFQKYASDAQNWMAEMFGGAFFHGFFKIMEGRFLMGLTLIGGKALLWLIVAAGIILPIVIAVSEKNPIIGLVSVVFVFHVLHAKYTKDKASLALKIEIFKNFWAINRIYLLTSSVNVNWDILGKELDSTRAQGIPWLPSLYTAVRGRSEPVGP